MVRSTCISAKLTARLLAILCSLFLFSLSSGAGAGGVTRGAMLANSCATCHGTDGGGSGRIPRINDFSKQDLVEMMQEFRSGEEKSTIMDRHAKGYTDNEVGMIADYFTQLKK